MHTLIKYCFYESIIVKSKLDFSDGAAGSFKNNLNMLNLAFHKEDFGIDACWTYTATAHGKGPGDGVGGLLKSTARRHTLLKNILLSSARDFYEFSKKQQMETARSCNKNEPSVHVFFLGAEEVNRVSIDIIDDRSDILKRARLSECTFYRVDYFLSLGTINTFTTMGPTGGSHFTFHILISKYVLLKKQNIP
jgi:hypothetical protein